MTFSFGRRIVKQCLRGVSISRTCSTSSSTKVVPSKDGVHEGYMQLVNSNKLRYDEHQYKVVKTLERVQQGIHQCAKAEVLARVEDTERIEVLAFRGLYIHGEVGTGKTMLMDLFLHSTELPDKRRVHFHKFMLEVHQIIHTYKQELLRKYGREKNLNMDPNRDPILHCARVIRESAQLLCFDEFQVTDIADAIIMTKVCRDEVSFSVVIERYFFDSCVVYLLCPFSCSGSCGGWVQSLWPRPIALHLVCTREA